jgi:cytochrome P450
MGQVRTPVPPPLDTSVIRALAREIRGEVAARRRGPLPPGSLAPSWRHTRDTVADPLPMLLDHERRYGPVFTIRTFHLPIVWAIGAEANHQILVSDFDAFEWRGGRFSDLWPLLGDGMLNIDGSYHREMRRLLLPAFHRESVLGVADTMIEEAEAAAARLGRAEFDLYPWTRELALRIAMRALLGMTSGSGREHALASAFERALDFHARPVSQQIVRGPGSPYARTQRARRELDALVHAEIAERRRAGDHGRGVLGMLLGATDGEGGPLPDAAVRDQAVTLLFAGHDTTTATLTFLLYELAGAPAAREALEAELDALVPDGRPSPEQLDGTRLPVLERTLMETLRRYPPAWVGPRRARRDVTIAGVGIPEGAFVHYSSWVTHHLSALYEDPFRFEPDRFLPDRAAALPKGAYVPFGGGSRMCLGKRFGEVELRALTAVLCRRFRVEPVPGGPPMQVATSPTLGPRGGLRVTVRPRH